LSGVGGQSVAPPDRCTAIDVLKALAIVTVVWIHAYERWPLPHVPLLWDMMMLTRFAVPAFFFTSGFLYFSSTPIPAAVVARRLHRVLVPYLIASALALSGRWLLVGAFPARQAAYELLTGSAVSVYYFVPLLAGALFLLPLLSRVPSVAVPALALFLLGGLLSEVYLPGMYLSPANDPFFWEFRSPLRWWGYFLAGWVVARSLPRIRRRSPRTLRTIGAAALTALGGLFVVYSTTHPPEFTRVGGVIIYAAIYATILGVFFCALPSPERAGVRWLSDATYPIYLYHPFFISGWQAAIGRRFPEAWLLTDGIGFLIGLGGSVAVVLGGRRLLGRRARSVLG